MSKTIAKIGNYDRKKNIITPLEKSVKNKYYLITITKWQNVFINFLKKF